MKNWKTLPLITAIFCASVLSLSLGAGCASADLTAYVAVGSTGAAANAAIGAYNAYRKSHNVPDDQVLQVRNVVDVFYNAAETVRAAKNAQAAATLSTDPNAISAANANVEIALKTLEGAAGPVVTLINSILPPKQ